MEVSLSAFPVPSSLAYQAFYLFVLLPSSLVLQVVNFLETYLGDLGTGLFLIALAVLGHYAAGQEYAVASDVLSYLATLGVLIDFIDFVLGGMGP